MTSTAGNTGRQRAAAGGARRRKDAPVPVSERREHLVRLAADLFAEKGYQATTVRNIADEAGILSGSLYHHFDSKESIVDEILTSFLDEIATATAALTRNDDPRATISGLIRACFATLGPHRAAIVVIQNDWNYLTRFERFAYLARSEEETEHLWTGLIERGQESGVFRADLDPRMTYRLIRDSIWPTVRWFRPGGGLDEQDLADHYVKVLFDGICAGA